MTQSAPKYFAVVPAAGSGKRMSLTLPKQYALIDEFPVITYTLSSLYESQFFEKIIVVLSDNDCYWPKISVTSTLFREKIMTCKGGEQRADSVLAAIQALSVYADKDDWVFVHDAARCGLTEELLQRLKHATQNKQSEGAILAIPVVDSLKKVDGNGKIISSVDRKNIWYAQTPQCFRFGALLSTLSKLLTTNESSQQKNTITDESSAMALDGVLAEVVLSTTDNIKITLDEDLQMMTNIIRKQLISAKRCSPEKYFEIN